MEPRLSYTLVGLFVLLLAGALVLASLWLIGVGPKGELRSYVVYLEESVAGLNTESLVKYQGVDVGTIKEIGLDPEHPGRVRLRIEVRADTPVNEDTVASLTAQGLTGLVYFLELHGGDANSAPLAAEPGEAYPVIPAEPSLLSRLERDGLGLLGDVKSAAAELRDTLVAARKLLGEDNQQAIATTLENASDMTGRLSEAANSLEAHIDRFGPVLDDITRAGQRLPDLADHAASTLGAAEAAAGDVRRAANRLDDLVTLAGPGLVELSRSGLPQVSPLLRDLRDLTARLNNLAADLESNPSLLLYGRPHRPGPGETR
jgi:phospholipid/cholesterol/gamma-HCH transport system substrate-binding protein